MAGAWHAAFLRLCTLERRIEVDELLQSFELPLQANEKEMDGEREWRLAHAQLKNLMVSVWADGTPMCNRSFQAHTFSFMCASPARHRATCLGSGGPKLRSGCRQLRSSDLRGVGRGQESSPTAAALDIDPQGRLALRARPCASRSPRGHADIEHADCRARDACARAGSMDQRGLALAATLPGHPLVRQRALQVPILHGGA